MNKGYTLVEVLITAAVVVLVSGGIFMALSSSRQAWDTLEARTALQLELRKVVSRISDDLRQTSMSQVFSDSDMTGVLLAGVPYDAIYFYVPEGINPSGAIIWNVTDPVGYALVNGTIVRTAGAAALNMSSGITDLNFTVLANDVIRIDVSCQKIKAVEHGQAVVDASLESAVALRNN